MKPSAFLGALALAAILVACPPPPPPVEKPTIIVEPVNGEVVTQMAANVIRSVAVATQVQFKATIQNATDQRVTWSVAEAATATPNTKFGIVDQNGNYTSPTEVPSPAIATIRATSVATPSVFGDFQLTIIKSGGLNGTVTLNEGLITTTFAPDALRLQSLGATGRTSKPNWNNARIQGEVLVISNSGLSVQNLSSRSATLRTAVSKSEGEFIRVQVPKGMTDQAFAEKIASESGAVVQPNYQYHLLDAPNDQFYNDQQTLVQIDAPGAWASQVKVPDGLIAVIDSGVKANHADLAGRVIPGKDFCPTYTTVCQGEDTDPEDIAVTGADGHGTFATGIIAAKTNNGIGIAGMTHEGKVLAIKVFGVKTEAGKPNLVLADSVAVSKGIAYAVAQGAKVLSMSLGVCANEATGFDTVDKLVEKAIDAAVTNNVTIVAAAGNNAAEVTQGEGKPALIPCPVDNNATPLVLDPSIQFPANHPNVIAVGSVDATNFKSSFSAFGAQLDLVAPGEQIASLGLDGGYTRKSGTSFAAPYVAAVAGLIRAKNPALTRAEVQNILESSAKDIGSAGKDPLFGAGLLQSGKALAKAEPVPVNTPPRVKTSVYMYADRLLDAPAGACTVVVATNRDCYDGTGGDAGRGVITINGTNGTVAYSITLSRNGTALKAGKYRVVACVNKNSNAIACDSGDLGVESALNLDFNGTALTVPNLVLAALP